MIVAAAAAGASAQLRWALLFGNFVIGSGVMCAVGTLNDIARSLQVSVSLAGQLVAIAAAVICFGAPSLAGVVAGFDRRRLLTLSLAWYAVGHALCAAMPSYGALLPVRALTVLGAAVFTPQAAAAIGFMTAPQQRGQAITFIFVGWSVASVLGMPMAAWLGETFGWRVAFLCIAALALAAALWVHAAMPDGVRPAALSRQAWRQALTHPVLIAMVLVTALSGAGQFTLFSYFAPYYRLRLGASAAHISALFVWFGLFGLIGNVLVSRYVDRIGAHRAVAITLGLMLTSLVLWPLGTGYAAIAAILVPWGLGCFAGNSAQQARLSIAAPALAPALMALNTSAIYLGQAAGASTGGWLIAHAGYGTLSVAGAFWMAIAIGLSLWAGRRTVAVPVS